MRKISCFLVFTLLNIVGFTSCLDGGSNVQTFNTVGVLSLSDKNLNPVLKSAHGDLYAPELSTMMTGGQIETGGCYLVQCTIDQSSPENSQSNVSANGYMTATISSVAEASKYYTKSFLTDTAVLLTEEIAVSGISSLGYASDYLFFYHDVNQASDEQLSWDLSYDPETMIPAMEDEARYYDLFLRAVRTNTSDKTTTALVRHLNAYRVSDFLRMAAMKEKEILGDLYSSTSQFKIRINYVHDITEDAVIEWENSTMSAYIESFLSLN